MSLKNWTIGKKLWFLSFVTVAIFISVGMYNQSTTYKLTSKLDNLGHVQLPIIRLMTLSDMMHDALRASVYRAFLAIQKGNNVDFKEAKVEYQEFAKNISQYLDDITKNRVEPLIKDNVVIAQQDVEVYVQVGSTIFDLLEKGKVDEAYENLPKYLSAFENLEEKLEKLGDQIEKSAQSSVQESESFANFAETMSLAIIVLGSLITLILSFWNNRNLTKQLKDLTRQLHNQNNSIREYADGVSQSADSLSSASVKQASSMQETASAMEEINAMVGKTSENSRRLYDSTQESMDVVNRGREAVQMMTSEMDTIKQSNSEVMHQISESNSQIKGIVNIINEIGSKAQVINDIVFQTKLLSFNASVEAARAGEHGKGFAVVAEEVGNLAQMSGDAAKEISKMLDSGILSVNQIIDGSQDRITRSLNENAGKIESGKRAADQCDAVFAKVVEQVGEVTNLSSEISKAIEEQRVGLEEIGKAVTEFSQSIQINSSTAQSASKIANDLQQSFQALNELMSTLDSMMNGKGPKDSGQF